MKRTTTNVRFLLLCLLCASTLAIQAQTTQIEKNSSWTYLNAASGSAPGSTWIDSGYATTGWATANGVFGRGSVDGATITTTLSNYLTTYFRKEITLTDHEAGSIDINLLCEDGAVVYINGTEVYRYNMPSGTVSYSTTASSAIGGSEEGDYDLTTVADTYLVDGVNTIAVELHNQSLSSSDLGFDLELITKEGLDSANIIMYSGEEWKYLDDGSNQGSAWYGTGFNDASWDSGSAVLGYGTITGASVSTTLSYGGNSSDKHPTTYFRKEVTLSSPDYNQLELQLLVDDGAVIYINGKKAFSFGMPATYDFETYANFTGSGSDEGDYDVYYIPDTFLVDGVNTFAAEVHQVNASSSDLGFDMQIIGSKQRIVNGEIFMDMDGNATKSGFDTWGSGAIEIRAYNDADSNGIYTSEEVIGSDLTDPHGNYEILIDMDVRHLAVKLMTEDMDEQVEYTTDTIAIETLTLASNDTVTNDFGQLGPRSLCLLIADDQSANDEYYIANRITGKQEFVATMETNEIEALAIRVGMDSMWAFDDGQFGSVDLFTGEFTAIGTGVGYGTGLIGGSSAGHSFTDIDGLAYDPNNDILYGVERRSGSGVNDLLVAINRSTGDLIDGHFGSGREFLEITGTGIKEDLDDIAFDPATGQLLAVNNENNGDSTRYISIDPTTSIGTVISIIGVGDFEGLGYYNTGELYGTTGVEGKPGYEANTFYSMSKESGIGTKLDTLYAGAIDVEACDCLTGPTENLISGTVFYDNNTSGTYDKNVDTAYGGIKVYLYRDANDNGQIDATDHIIDSTYTDPGTGFYVFITDSLGRFLTTPSLYGTPFYTMKTTTNDSITERALFLMHGDFDGKNDFGFHITYGMPYLAAEFLEIDAVWNNNGNALVTWSTANETNSSHYVVERSSDANTYKAVGIVDAVGESHEKLDYGFIDITANEVDSKTIYYRIQEVNYNGNPSYSGVAVLTKELVRNTVVYPNPIKDNINVNYNAYGEYTIEITSITGHTLLQLEGFKPDEYSPIRIDGLGQLPQGIYFLRVRHNGIDSVTKFFL